MANKHLGRIGAWASSAIVTSAVVGPLIYGLSKTKVEANDLFSEFSMTQPMPQKAQVLLSNVEASKEAFLESRDFSYEGVRGPESWHKLHKEYSACGKGDEQSPIDLEHMSSYIKSGVIRTQYRPERIRLVHESNRLMGTYDAGHFTDSENLKLYAQSFDFHIPSEHTLKGRHFDAELQIEHRGEDGRLAYVSVFLQKGTHHPEVEKILATIPDEYGRMKKRVAINLAQILPKKLDYFNYRGSMTIPPCQEGVSWYVLQTPVEISMDQFDRLAEVIRFNARPLQRRNMQQGVAFSSN